jgi:RHS repeat-associated protein
VFYIRDDALGSPNVITDELGRPLVTQRFSPLGGKENSPLETAVRSDFTGHQIDKAIGFVDAVSRLYDPRTGLFASPDTVVQAPYRSQGLNPYAYGFNNFLKWKDPSGHVNLLGMTMRAISTLAGTIAGSPESEFDVHMGEGLAGDTSTSISMSYEPFADGDAGAVSGPDALTLGGAAVVVSSSGMRGGPVNAQRSNDNALSDFTPGLQVTMGPGGPTGTWGPMAPSGIAGPGRAVDALFKSVFNGREIGSSPRSLVDSSGGVGSFLFMIWCRL